MPANDLMISVSGVRGIVGRSLTPELLVRLGHAFGTYLCSGRVVVGRDTRASGEMAKHAVLSGLLAAGCKVIDAGICATPTATLLVEQQRAAGGVMVTASHNPIEWNALKFFRSDGMYLNAEESRDLLNVYYSGQFACAAWDQLHPMEFCSQASAQHMRRVLSILDVKLIRACRFKVALDCVNGAGCEAAQLLLNALDCKVVPVHCTPNGLFPHKPEPVAANLGDLCAAVPRSGAHLGAALDPDADRVALADEHGTALGEEASLALCTRHALAGQNASGGAVVINISTSRMTEDVALAAGCSVVRTPAGEVHVAEKMKEVRAVFGGEGNGGIIDPRVHYGRDALAGLGLVLEALARSKQQLSQLAASLPHYHMLKTRIDCPQQRSRAIVRQLRSMISGVRADTRDGLRLDWSDGWVQLRASNTEPVLRIIAEARTEARARERAADFEARVQRLLAAKDEPAGDADAAPVVPAHPPLADENVD